MRKIFTCCITILLTILCLQIQAQDFRVQLAAFIKEVPLSYFSDSGIHGVYMLTDQNNIYRYYIGNYHTREEAEVVHEEMVDKGLDYAQIIDMEEQRALCGTPCPYITESTTYASDEAEQLYLRTIYFDFDKAILNEAARQELKILSSILKERKEHTVHIFGHSDSKGNCNYNLKLSIERARAAKNYLIAKGIDPERLDTEVFGEGAPVAINHENGNDSPEGRKFNRRVVIVIKNEQGEVINNITDELEVPDHLILVKKK